MFFVVRVNNALALLNINPQMIQSDYRQAMQTAGKLSGASPQEVAVFIASQLPIAHRMNLNYQTIRSWLRKRKIDPNNPEIRDALFNLDADCLISK